MKNNLFPILTLALLATFISQPPTVLAQGLLTPPGAPAPLFKTLAQIEPRTPISVLPFFVTVPGAYYVVSNLTGVSGSNGISISAANVDLDLGGFVLGGVPGSLAGISITGADATVRHGTVSNWGNVGVSGGVRCHLERVNVFNSGSIGFNLTQRSRVVDCVAAGNLNNGVSILETGTTPTAHVSGTASHFNGQHGFQGTAIFTDCTAQGNSNTGFTAKGLFTRCVAAGNTNMGFDVDFAQLESCSARQNGSTGINAGNSALNNCVASANTGSGMNIADSTVQNSRSELNTVHGIAAGDAHIVNNFVSNNGSNGIINSLNTAQSTIRGNTLKNNAAAGILVSGNSVVMDNQLYSSNSSPAAAFVTHVGIRAVNTFANRIEGNYVRGHQTAYQIFTTTNVIVRNIAVKAATNYSISINNTVGPILTNHGFGGTFTNVNPWANFSN